MTLSLEGSRVELSADIDAASSALSDVLLSLETEATFPDAATFLEDFQEVLTHVHDSSSNFYTSLNDFLVSPDNDTSQLAKHCLSDCEKALSFTETAESLLSSLHKYTEVDQSLSTLLHDLQALFQLHHDKLSHFCSSSPTKESPSTALTVGEDVLIFRALTDVNLPKFLQQDVSLFLSIISDLFPTTKVPDPDYALLLGSIFEVIHEFGLIAHKEFVKKVIQLYETVMVRHGLMLVGLALSGKSSVLRVLGEAMTRLKTKSKNFTTVHRHYLNPKSVTGAQLYGYRDELSQEVVDGLIGVLVRNSSRDQSTDRHWIVFDGPVDAVWIESMNTVLDDNKKLCLPSGDIIQLTPHMTMMFEVADLAVASPATVSRCGMVYCELSVIGWSPIYEAWIGKFPSHLQEFKSIVTNMVDYLFEDLLDFVKKNVKEPVKTSAQILVKSFMNIFDALIEEYIPSEDSVSRMGQRNVQIAIESTVIFAIIWSLGASGMGDDRIAFNQIILEKISLKNSPLKLISSLPKHATLYDYMFDYSKSDWIPWYQTVPDMVIPENAQFHEIIVETSDTIRYSYLLETLIKAKKPVLFTGPTGTSKTVIMQRVLLEKLDKTKYSPVFLGFSARTHCNQVQDILDSKIDSKRRKDVYGPPLGQRAVVFVDDLNMPKKEVYGAQPPIEILRQWMDYGGWYDRKTLTFRKLVDILFVSAMGHPGGGRTEITQRFTRHFNLISFCNLESDSLTRIFSTMFNWFANRFSGGIRGLSSTLVETSVKLYNSISINLLPTPSKSHYTFNLRDLSKVFQGIMQSSPNTISSPSQLLSIWVHESCRVFRDRLVDNDDRQWFDSEILKTLRENFPGMDLDEIFVPSSPILFGSVLNPLAEPLVYESLPELSRLQSIMRDFLEDYNSTSQNPMSLVLFEYCVVHVLRVCRILNQPFGHALLIGVGGSGRQSAAKLAVSICDMELAEVEITRSFGVNDWKDLLKGIMKNCGLREKRMALLLADSKITNESFLEDVNSILNSGEVPNLFPAEELIEIFEVLTPLAQKSGRPSTKQSIWSWFVERCKKNLHVVLCLSPIGDAFRNRLRMFPSLVNCCTIDWFTSWPDEALRSVASEFLQDADLDSTHYQSVVSFFVAVHSSIEAEAARFFAEYKRQVFITPTFFLELINAFKGLLERQSKSINSDLNRYKIGLSQLATTSESVKGMQAELTDLKPQLIQAAKETEDLMVKITADQAVADEKKSQLQVETAEVEELVQEAAATEAECNAALEVALPALNAAVKALQNLNKGDVVEIRSLRAPPRPVKLVLEAICIMKNVKPVRKPNTKEKDYWEPSVKMLANVTEFFNSLYQYDFDNISDSIIQSIEPYINSPDFAIKVITQASVPAGALCEWVHAVYRYHLVVQDIAPRKAALAEAREKLKTLNAELDRKRDDLNQILQSIQILTDNFNAAEAKKKELEDKYNTCERQLDRAVKLLDGLKDERVSWSEAHKKLEELSKNILGDVLLSAAAIIYLGPFNQIFRQSIMNNWVEILKTSGIALTDNFSLQNCIGDPVEIQSWNINKLPPNKFSIENGIMSKNSKRWPLFIDPQSQASRWIKLMEAKNGLVVVKMTDNDMIKVLERAVQFGKPVLLENVPQTLDPSLDPLLTRAVFKSGGMLHIQLGDTVPYDENFRLYITTKLPNPTYAPEICAKVCLVNFCITPLGLEDQLLSTVVQAWEPALEEQKNELILQKARCEAERLEIEKRILSLLANAEGNILDDDVLIDTLGQSKITAAKIAKDMAVARETEAQIDRKRELFEPIAQAASVLFFCTADLSLIDPMYQYSLEWFSTLFKAALAKSPTKADNKTPQLLYLKNSTKKGGLTPVEHKLTALNKYFTNSLFLNVCRGLFSRDKLLFSFILCAKIMISKNVIDENEYLYLLSGSTSLDKPKIPNPSTDLFDERTWKDLYGLNNLPAFSGILDDIIKNLEVFKIWMDNFGIISRSNISNLDIPLDWSSKLSFFQQIIVLKTLCPDKLLPVLKDFISCSLSRDFVEIPPFTLAEPFADSAPAVPLVFVLSPSADPVGDLLAFAESKKMSGSKFLSVSLGQGQGVVAEQFIKQGYEQGKWVLLQNCHLAPSWMMRLEELVAEMGSNPNVHPDFRLWLTSMPSTDFPVSILQQSVKITTEPPSGLKSNLMRSYAGFSDELLSDCTKPVQWRRLLYSLSFYHAQLLERKRFSGVGFNVPYDWNDSDRKVSIQHLQLLLDKYEEIPFEALIYLIGYIHYGGRITDAKDFSPAIALLKRSFCEEALVDGYNYVPGNESFVAPSDGTLADYISYIDNLQSNSSPEVFGLHSNAQIIQAKNETYQLLDLCLSLQPRALGSGGSGSGVSVDDVANGILNVLPQLFDVDAVYENYPLSYLKSMNTVLVQELMRYNGLIAIIRSSLQELLKALKGVVVMSNELETVCSFLMVNKVPGLWAAKAYPSLKPLDAWINDLIARLKFLQSWIDNGPPAVFWISGLFFPQGFLTGTLQNFARKYSIPIDSICFEFHVVQTPKEQITQPPEEGCYIHGLFLDGARWDMGKQIVADSLPKQLYCELPVIWLKPVVADQKKVSKLSYPCPTYKTSERRGTLSTTGHSTNFILNIDLPSDRDKEFWYLRGVAAICQLDF
ncbi:hypothetical protein RCL1_001445 [Eukaryota sp. TZLM3-RCL]